jgi:LysR family transcriptional regulator, transcriptional activator of the cysJI operon
MTLRHFTIFVTVCEAGSMTKAALRLAISQPSVSQAVREMEEHYGIPLFDRLGKRLVLTDAGTVCLMHSRQILKSLDDAAASIKEKGHSNLIRVGATVTIGTYLLPVFQTLTSSALYPVVENTARIERLLLDGALDLGLVEGETSSPHLMRRPFYRDRLVIVCAPDNRLASRARKARELDGRGFYIRELGSGSRELFTMGMRKRGVTYHIAGEINNTEALKNFAHSDTENLAVISALAVDKSIKVIDVSDLNLERSFDIVYHKDRVITASIREFMRSLASFAKTRTGALSS